MTSSVAVATISLDNMAGGLEKNIIYLVNHLAARGVKVTLMTFDLPDAIAFYEIDPRVSWCRLGTTTPHARIDFIERCKLLMRIRFVLRKNRVDSLVCFHHGILFRFLLGSIFTKVRLICSERNSLTLYRHIRARKWNFNFLLLFCVDAITVQFPSYITQYPNLLRRRIHVIHNPVFPSTAPARKRLPIILSIGRLAAQKRFDLLVEAFYLATRDLPQWTLFIVGDGPLKAALEAHISQLGLTERVRIIPATSDLNNFFSEATFYCQPSMWEGFPNAQAEAMAAGVIPVGLSTTSGVVDMIEHGVNGLLSGETANTGETANSRTLAKALRSAIENQNCWSGLSMGARRIVDKYSVESWQFNWDTLLSLVDEQTGANHVLNAMGRR